MPYFTSVNNCLVGLTEQEIATTIIIRKHNNDIVSEIVFIYAEQAIPAYFWSSCSIVTRP